MLASTTVIHTLPLHDALPISSEEGAVTVSGTTTDVENGQTVTVHLTDGSTTVTTTATVTGNVWTAAAADISGLTDGPIKLGRADAGTPVTVATRTHPAARMDE